MLEVSSFIREVLSLKHVHWSFQEAVLSQQLLLLSCFFLSCFLPVLYVVPENPSSHWLICFARRTSERNDQK